MHLEIVLSTTLLEYVLDKSIITTLYDLHKNGNLDLDSRIEGWIRVSAAYEYMKTYLTAEFPNFRIDADSYYIGFRDPEIEKVFVTSSYCTDGVGITQADAARVTLIAEGMFKDNSNIRDFSDLATIFPNCTRISNNAFKGSSIETIDMSNITNVGSSAFEDSNLTGEISLPSLIYTSSALPGVGSCAFSGSKITKVSNLGRITELIGRKGYSEGPFFDCDYLLEVVLPSSILKLGDAFSSCAVLNTVKGYEYILDLAGFYTYSDANKVFHFDNLTDVSYNSFGGGAYSNAYTFVSKQWYIPKFKSSSYSKTVSYANHANDFRGAFARCQTDLLYFGSLETLYPGDLAYTLANALVINSPQVVTLANRNNLSDGDSSLTNVMKWDRVFAGFTGTIYVPDNLLSAYQSDTKWSSLNLNILKISTLNGGVSYATEALWEQAGKPVALIEEYIQ